MDDYDDLELASPYLSGVDLGLWLWLILGLIMAAALVLLVAGA